MTPDPLVVDGPDLQIGDRIYWRYIHRFRTGHDRSMVKYGQFLGRVKHTAKFKGPQMARVQFDGNKHPSRVPFNELRKAKL